MIEVDAEAIMLAEDLSHLVKSREWAHFAKHMEELKQSHSATLLNIGRRMIEPGVAEFYAHRIAAIDELSEWIDDTIDRGIRERSRFVDAEATERPSDVPAPTGQQESK